MRAINGENLNCVGEGIVTLSEPGAGTDTVRVAVLVVESRPLGFDVILGMNGISALGGVMITGKSVVFGLGQKPACAGADNSIRVEEKDFAAEFSPDERCWTIEWKWTEGEEPSVLTNRVPEYSMSGDIRTEYETELRKWIDDGWLVPYDEAVLGKAKGLIPLMAVTQQNKAKVRPVLDFREINGFIDTYTADADVCADKLREWRRQGTQITALDLKSAYLQIHVHPSLWSYQTVLFEGRRYCLTRLGLGLNVAPMIMKTVLNKVLSMSANIQKGTSSYVDDLIVNEDVVSAAEVRDHLARYGLVTKDPERVWDGTRLLGLRVWGEQGVLRWQRDNTIEDMPEPLTRRKVFSVCGKLVSHYPVCGWLRVAAAFIKRRANALSEGWDDPIAGTEVSSFLTEVITEVKRHDPARGQWNVSGESARVWVDASSLAIGVALESNGTVIEDATWLRKDETSHINMAELDAVIKGVNLAIAWGMKEIEIFTDSATVHQWISDGLSGKSRLKTKAAGEMLIRRRVQIVTSLAEEYALRLSVRLVPSAENKADILTRVPQRWLKAIAGREMGPPQCSAAELAERREQIQEVHCTRGHPGVKRTLYFARRVNPLASRKDVREVVKQCDQCRSIDPAPVQWQGGTLEVDTIWERVGMDVSHYRGRMYLTLIDCGPSRFTIWRQLRTRTSAEVTEQLEAIFLERGAPKEILTDNDTAFRSKAFEQFASKWDIVMRYRCAYVASGNGIIERCHRSVKVIAARMNCSIAEACYWYNVTPLDGSSRDSAPANCLYTYEVSVKGEIAQNRQEISATRNPYAEGDSVWMRPPQARCDRQFDRGVVQRVLSDQAVEVNGVPRHIRDLRRRTEATQAETPPSRNARAEDEPMVLTFRRQPGLLSQAQQSAPPWEDDRPPLRRSERLRRAPDRLEYG